VIAHAGGVPLEETLLPLVSGGGAALLLLPRAWLRSRLRRGHELNGSAPRIVDNPDGSRRPPGAHPEYVATEDRRGHGLSGWRPTTA